MIYHLCEEEHYRSEGFVVQGYPASWLALPPRLQGAVIPYWRRKSCRYEMQDLSQGRAFKPSESYFGIKVGVLKELVELRA
jgi:hypothetical protein